jgi:hypothetical protein
MQKTSVGDLGFGAGSDDFPIVITTLPANTQQHKIAFRGFAILVVVVAIVMLANIQTARVDAFVPVTQTMMCITDLLTAAFLFAQFSVHPQRALLAVSVLAYYLPASRHRLRGVEGCGRSHQPIPPIDRGCHWHHHRMRCRGDGRIDMGRDGRCRVSAEAL